MISLSFDTDHIDEERMREFLDTVRIPGRGTFFCTQTYEALGEPHELGPHVRLDAGAPEWEAALDAGREWFPDAVGFRAHGCVAGHWLSAQVAARGYTYITSQDVFGAPSPGPFREAWGVWHVPIYYMETLDLAFAENWPDRPHQPFSDELIERAISSDELCVFVFHPIHLLLNSESVEGYVSRRKALLEGSSSEEARHDGTGARTFYDRLVDEMEAAGISSATLAEVVRDAAGTTLADARGRA